MCFLLGLYQNELPSQASHLCSARLSKLTWQVSQNKTRQGHFTAQKGAR